MAKRGAQQLQAEISTTEELEKFLSQDGLLVLDVYSSWFGSCTALVACLRKIKMEIAGDDMKLATVKCDEIEALKRFYNKSEPIWLFLWKDKVVNSYFGSDVPALSELLIKELEIKKDPSQANRKTYELTELTALEVAKSELQVMREMEAIRTRTEAVELERLQYLYFVTDEIMSRLPDMGVTIFMPHVISRDLYRKLCDVAEKKHLTPKEKVTSGITEEQLGIINLDAQDFPDYLFTHVQNKGVFMVCWKLPDEELRPVHEILHEFVTLLSVQKPEEENVGQENNNLENADDEDSDDQLLLKSLSTFIEKEPENGNETEQVVKGVLKKIVKYIAGLVSTTEEDVERNPSSEMGTLNSRGNSNSYIRVNIPPVWTPTNPRANAALIYLYFRILTEHFLPPDPVPDPPHVAIAFNANKRHDILRTVRKYESDVIAYGFFTSDDYQTAELIADSNQTYNKRPSSNIYDRLIIKLALPEKETHAFLGLAGHDPSYISMTTDEGKIECESFFPKGYVTGPEASESDTSINSENENQNADGDAENANEETVES